MTLRSAQVSAFPRSLLFVPANRPAMFAHAWASEAEAIVFDLEDSVPPGEKTAARDALASVQLPDSWTRPVFVRLNAHGTADFDADVLAAAIVRFNGVVLPKVERATDVRAVDQTLAARERPDRPLSLILLLETPGGIMRAAELADSGVKRVTAFAFGTEDYRGGLGVDALDPALADFARATVVNAAAAAGVVAIDAPELEFKDMDRLRTATARARSLGFRAKFAIHPSQVAVIHEELGRGHGEDRAWAARVVEAYQRATAEGKGSALLDGRMIDEATVKRARAILKP